MKKEYIYTILAALLLAVVAFFFFFPDDVEGNVLQQHDTVQGMANGQEAKAYEEATGETPRWTDSLFGGMPMFQISPSYASAGWLNWISKVYMLGLPAPAGILFGMMIGFFIMCLCFKMKWYYALFGSVAWGLSTYFIIIIGAGHIWKFVTLSYIPPTIGGLALCYRGKYLGGMSLTALFAALQLQSNHPQMSYYFMFVMLFMVLAWLWVAIKEKKTARWGIATLCVAFAGVLGLAANATSLYNTYEYSKETVRGRATDLTPEKGTVQTGGMDREAITTWSYGLDETWSLLIPNVKGGATIKPVAGENQLMTLADTEKVDELDLSPQEVQFLSQFPQYFGDQPMTNGPVYVGAFVLLLAILAMFVVDNPMKWALFAVSILAILLSWGHNFQGFTDFFIDNFPLYNKFRTVSSILVIVEFTLPVLAVMCVKKIAETPDFYQRYKWTFFGVMGGGALVCIVGWLWPGIFGSAFSAQEVDQLTQMGVFTSPEYSNIWNAVREIRMSLVSADSLRSLMYIILGTLVVYLFIRKAYTSSTVMVCALTAVVLIDLFSVNKRYVNTENFTEATDPEIVMRKSPADEQILRDKSNYRVMDVDGFSDARSSYFHKTIGGYHAAKLTRYNDLITHQISKGNQAVFDMLNAKYFIQGGQVQQNPGALGNAWFVETVDYVPNADAEMKYLDSIRPATHAVADRQFEKVLGRAAKTPGDTIYETKYAPNRLNYKYRSAKEGVAVFSEIYFPWGWTATVDGREIPIGRVDYVLRALRLPAGEHEVEFVFDPKSVRTADSISVASMVVIYLLCLGALGMAVMRVVKRKRNGDKGNA